MTGAQQPPVPEEEQELRGQIERTRQQLGQTVEQLAVKADVKSAVRAKRAELTGRAKDLIARQRPVPLAIAATVLVAGCLGLLWWKRR